MTLFPYCTDIILCISTPGTFSVHKNGSLPSVLLWCKWNWEFPRLWQKTHDRNGLSRSHLHHNGRRAVDHVYFVMPNQQYSQLQNVPIVRIILSHLRISNKMQRYTVHLHLETALHVSGGISTHHQELIQLYLQRLVFVRPLLLPTANGS